MVHDILQEISNQVWSNRYLQSHKKYFGAWKSKKLHTLFYNTQHISVTKLDGNFRRETEGPVLPLSGVTVLMVSLTVTQLSLEDRILNVPRKIGDIDCLTWYRKPRILWMPPVLNWGSGILEKGQHQCIFISFIIYLSIYHPFLKIFKGIPYSTSLINNFYIPTTVPFPPLLLLPLP